MPARWRLLTARAPGTGAAIGVFHLEGDIERAFAVLAITPIDLGHARLRSFGGIDRGIAARPAMDQLLLMPHAGPAVLRRMEAWLVACGLQRGSDEDPRALFPEAASVVESRMLHALARAASPLAIDVLLDQPRRWAGGTPEIDAAASRILQRLIEPPTVVAYGPPNIGKSTLLNTLAGRAVSIVADEPGTTRDHVGVRLDVAGLVVSYLDAPGMGDAANEIERAAQSLACSAARLADLVLLCADRGSPFLESPNPDAISMRVGLRSDLGPTPGADVSISAATGAGVDVLTLAIREALAPSAVLTDPRAWRFWEAAPALPPARPATAAATAGPARRGG